MKKYPYTDTTDLVVYQQKPEKKRKPKIWLACISSAVAASLLTGGVMTGTMYYMQQNTPQLTVAESKQPGSGSPSSGSASTLANDSTATGKRVLSTEEIAAQCGPSVVGVINKTTLKVQKYYNPFTGQYYYSQDPSLDGQTIEQGSGSGIILSTDGYVVTNQHVIEGASEVSVILNTGEEFAATIVGSDETTDLAVLKIDAGSTQLTAAVLGDSTTTEVGELAVAIGNPLGQEFSGTVTQGIISAVNRTMTVEGRQYNLIQTDAAINSGNSGGALINKYGEVIGINSVKLSEEGVEGMGFAIAISEAKPIIDALMSQGYVTRPMVGITARATDYGLFIDSVEPGSGAAAAGLQRGDMIMAVDGVEVGSVAEINTLRDAKKPGDTMKFKISRNGTTIEVDVTLTEQPADTQ